MRRICLLLLAMAVVAPATAKVVTEAVPYREGDVALEGYLAYDDAIAGKRPAVIVVPEWWGLNDYAKQRARQLAELGYVAFAIDMYGQGKVTDQSEQASQWAGALYTNPAKWRQRARAGFDVVANHARVDKNHIGAIGYCFGGSTVQQMAWSGLPLKAVVSFHGNLVPPTKAEAAQTKASVLICHGAADPLISDQDMDAFLKALGGSPVDWQLIMYAKAKHSFTNPKADAAGMDAVGYDEAADRRSWEHMRVFFRERLRGDKSDHD